MKYVSVTSPGSEMSKPIFNYFDDYLVSLGEPATSKAWTLKSILSHTRKLINEKQEDSRDISLYIDSGGFQIIVGYVSFNRITEFVDTYHFVLKKFKNEIDRIFALDVFSDTFFERKNIIGADGKVILKPNGNKLTVPDYPEVYSNEHPAIIDLYNANKYSMESSIELIKEFPQIADKQLFILQSGNHLTFNLWRELFTDLEVYKYYKLWSVGGLVGLKKSTNAKFSHAVPATLWLLTYQKHFDFTIDQVHWLGQSSRLSFLSMALFERLYGINMTSDSSQLVRFAPLDAKLPYIFKEGNDFKLAENKADVIQLMLPKHSIVNARCYISKTHLGTIKELKPDVVLKQDLDVHPIIEYNKDTFADIIPDEGVIFFSMSPTEYLELTGKLDNQTFIELQSQNLDADLHFGNLIADKIMTVSIDSIDEKGIRELHPIMDRGRTAKELYNNIQLFKQFAPIVEAGDLAAADTIMQTIVDSYIKESFEEIVEREEIQTKVLEHKKETVETIEIKDLVNIEVR